MFNAECNGNVSATYRNDVLCSELPKIYIKYISFVIFAHMVEFCQPGHYILTYIYSYVCSYVCINVAMYVPNSRKVRWGMFGKFGEPSMIW